MAYCPNCGSDHIQLKKETDVNWGRAVAGWALFGVVGGAVGAVTGEDKTANACLDCGTSWKAEDLYRTLQIIKNLTGEKLDLSREDDREYMNSFISEISPALDACSNLEKKYEKLIADKEKALNEGAGAGLGYGCMTWILVLFSAGALLGPFGILFTLILFPVIGWVIGSSSDKQKQKDNLKWIENTKREATKENAQAKHLLEFEVRKFMQNHPSFS